MSHQYLRRPHQLEAFNSGYTVSPPKSTVSSSHRSRTATQGQVALASAPGSLAALRISSKTRPCVKPSLRPEAHAIVTDQTFLVVITASRPAASGGDSVIDFSFVSREAPKDGQFLSIAGCPGYEGFKIWTTTTCSAYLPASAQMLPVGPRIEEIQRAALKAPDLTCTSPEVFVELLPFDAEVAYRATSPVNYAKLMLLLSRVDTLVALGY